MGGRNSAALLKALFFHTADKTAYPLVFALEDILRGTLLQSYAAFHKEYTVGDIPCKAHFMGHYEQGHGMILGKAPDDRKHFINKFRVERGCRLVKEHAPRFDGHGPGNGNTLLLASRHMGGILQFIRCANRLYAGLQTYGRDRNPSFPKDLPFEEVP